MRPVSILWTDDEIDLLKPHILFLENKGYQLSTASNGTDAVELVSKQHFDLIFLDESMPGLSGLETLSRIKEMNNTVPVVMITKNEEEDIMDAAIGSKISDYLLKPVNPKQILLTIKKHIDTSRLVTRETTSAYQSEFTNLGMQINTAQSFTDWAEVYKKLTYWDLQLDNLDNESMKEILLMQKADANNAFAKYIRTQYTTWFTGNNSPLLSPNIFKQKVFPHLAENKVVAIIIDNLRYDQWRAIYPEISDLFVLTDETIACSILPTATQYARNAMFAGLMPKEIKERFPNLWLDDIQQGGKNMHESQLMQAQLKRLGINKSFGYHKITEAKAGKKLVDDCNNILTNDLNFVVYNFVDMLSHSRTESKVIKELAADEAAYRSLTLSWFKHSYLFDFLKQLADNNIKVIITTDHGTVKVTNAIKVIGDKETSVNLRYKIGRNLSYKSKDIIAFQDPEKAHLPKINISSTYIFACSNNLMAYPNNYNYYVNYYRNTFQHGGVSLEEMMIPCVTLTPKL